MASNLPYVNDAAEMKVCTSAGVDNNRNPVLIEIDVDPEAKRHLYAFIQTRLIAWQASEGFAAGFVSALLRSLDTDGCQLTRATDAIQYMGEDVDAMNATLPRGPHYNDFALISVVIPMDFAADTNGVIDGVGYMRGHGYPIAAVHPSEFSCEWHQDTGVLTYNAELEPPLP